MKRLFVEIGILSLAGLLVNGCGGSSEQFEEKNHTEYRMLEKKIEPSIEVSNSEEIILTGEDTSKRSIDVPVDHSSPIQPLPNLRNQLVVEEPKLEPETKKEKKTFLRFFTAVGKLPVFSSFKGIIGAEIFNEKDGPRVRAEFGAQEESKLYHLMINVAPLMRMKEWFLKGKEDSNEGSIISLNLGTFGFQSKNYISEDGNAFMATLKPLQLDVNASLQREGELLFSKLHGKLYAGISLGGIYEKNKKGVESPGLQGVAGLFAGTELRTLIVKKGVHGVELGVGTEVQTGMFEYQGLLWDAQAGLFYSHELKNGYRILVGPRFVTQIIKSAETNGLDLNNSAFLIQLSVE